MELEVGEVRRPDQCRLGVELAVVDVFVVALAARATVLIQRGPVLGASLLVEERPLDPVRIALERDGALLEVRAAGRRDRTGSSR